MSSNSVGLQVTTSTVRYRTVRGYEHRVIKPIHDVIVVIVIVHEW